MVFSRFGSLIIVGHLRKLAIIIVAFGIVAISFREEPGGTPSRVADNLMAPLRELFGPGASTAGRLYGLSMVALAAGAIIYKLWKASRAKKTRALLANLVAAATAQVDHEDGMVQARGKEAVSARVAPQVPIRNESAN